MNGSVLADRYRVEARIGAGGMAEVFRGFDPVLGRTVAIKVLLPQFARDAGFVARFRREAQAAARLNIPSIVGVYDTGADGDTQYIVMEFVEGRTLAEFLAGGRRPTPIQAVELTQKIAAALGAAHEQGIVHRDIKPANVMVTRDGQVKVMDFGIARIRTDITAPQTSSVIGTPTYLSPEQAQGQAVDARSDLYSLGCVLYELLTGSPPFTGDTPVAIAYKQVNETPIPPSQRNADVPPRLDAVVMKCLAKNPANRYQSAGELSADLERVKHGQEVEATPLLPSAGEATQVIARPQATQVMPPPEPEGSSRKVWLGVLIGVLIVGLLLGGGYLLSQVLKNKDQAVAFGMPSVQGLTLQQATDTLTNQYGLVVADPPTRKATDASPPQTVLDQSPASGTLVHRGNTVMLTIAVPVKQVEVPDLTCMTLADAQTALTTAHLVLGSKTTTTSDACPAGAVVDQSIAPGTKVDRNSLVNVTVASGPATITLDDYTCQTLVSAQNQLQKLGLKGVFGGTEPTLPQCPNPTRVVSQNPTGGSTVHVGDTVTLFTGETGSPTETPAP